MAAGRRLGKSDLFLVRLWIEETENGAVAWCGKVQRPTTGEANLFHGWPGLIDLLLAMTPGADAGRASPVDIVAEDLASVTGDVTDPVARRTDH